MKSLIASMPLRESAPAVPIRVRLVRKLQEHFEYRVGFAAAPMVLRVTKFNTDEELAAYSMIDLFDDYRTLPIDIAIEEVSDFLINDIKKKLSQCTK